MAGTHGLNPYNKQMRLNKIFELIESHRAKVSVIQFQIRRLEAEVEAIELGNYTLAKLIRNNQVNPDEISGNSESIDPGNSN